MIETGKLCVEKMMPRNNTAQDKTNRHCSGSQMLNKHHHFGQMLMPLQHDVTRYTTKTQLDSVQAPITQMLYPDALI